jgi:hypothetical protein
MTQGDPRLPCARADRDPTRILNMSNSDKERGEKRGVLSTGRARKIQDTDADDRDDDED